MAYRGGYLPEQRRDIERRLRDGEILCVVATNALELGIDIGELDAVDLRRLPGLGRGHLAALRPRGAARRARASACSSRRARRSISTWRASREYLLGAPVEEARIDPDNVEILIQHLKCAAFELPFKRGEPFGSLGPAETEERARLPRRSTASCTSRTARSTGRPTPTPPTTCPCAASAGTTSSSSTPRTTSRSPRSTGAARTRCCTSRPSTSTTASVAGRALRLRKPQGVRPQRRARLLHRRDDLHAGLASRRERHRAACSRSDRGPAAGARSRVVEKVVGYKKIKFYTHENAGYGDVRLPEMQMHTTAFWLTVPEALVRARLGAGARPPSMACAASASRSRRWRRSRSCAIRATSGTTLGDAAPESEHEDSPGNGNAHCGSAPQGARRAATRLQPHAVRLRARPGGHWARRAHVRAARRASRAGPATHRALPLPRRVPGVRRPGRVDAQDHDSRAAALDCSDGMSGRSGTEP